MNPQSIILVVVIVVLFLFALIGAGKNKCGGSCGGCPYSGSCRKEKR